MSMSLAKLVIAALIAHAASVHSAGLGWLIIQVPDACFSGQGRGSSANGTKVMVHYEDRDGNGYLSFNAPKPKFKDVLIGAEVMN